MLLKEIFIFLYPSVGLISISAFVPQIVSLIKSKTSPINISIQSWSLWVLSALISLGYGLFHLEDLMFIIISLNSFLLSAYVVVLTINKRYVVHGHHKNCLSALVDYYFAKPFFDICDKKHINYQMILSKQFQKHTL